VAALLVERRWHELVVKAAVGMMIVVVGWSARSCSQDQFDQLGFLSAVVWVSTVVFPYVALEILYVDVAQRLNVAVGAAHLEARVAHVVGDAPRTVDVAAVDALVLPLEHSELAPAQGTGHSLFFCRVGARVCSCVCVPVFDAIKDSRPT